MKLYHNPRCGKSREALKLLGDVETVLYMDNMLSVGELREICGKLKIDPTELLRTNEEEYRELVKANGKPDNETALKWMHKHPKLMQRPILVKGNKAVIGRPPEKVLEL